MSEAAVAEKPKSKPDLKIDRKADPKAKESQLSMMTEGHACARVQYWLDPSVPIEETLKPGFWSAVAHKFMRPISTEGTYAGSIIEVRYTDMSMYAELFVRVVHKSALVVNLIGKPHYFGPKEVNAVGFDVRWNVGNQGFDIVRKSDREIVASSKDIKTREEAQAWIDKTVN